MNKIINRKELSVCDIQTIGNIGYHKALKIIKTIKKQLTAKGIKTEECTIPTEYVIKFLNLKVTELEGM